MDKLMENTESIDEQEILTKLTNLEDKLNKLKEFSKKSEELRTVRKEMLENLSKHDVLSESKTDMKRVQFAKDNRSEEIEPRNKKFSGKAQRSNSLYNLLTRLNSWQEEAKSKKTEIEMLKTKRQTLTESEQIIGFEEKIKILELENDELSDDVLHFILQNMNEGKEEYQDLILHLENENKAMEDTIFTLSEKVKFLKENIRALMVENNILRQKKHGLESSLSTEDMEMTYRQSMLTTKSSAMFPGPNMSFTFQDLKSPSVQFLHDVEQEDRLSLDKESEDSFTLDRQIASWKLDDMSMHDHLKRIEREHREMEVIQMKLNLVKRYVGKHGVKQINKDTFIEPYVRRIMIIMK